MEDWGEGSGMTIRINKRQNVAAQIIQFKLRVKFPSSRAVIFNVFGKIEDYSNEVFYSNGGGNEEKRAENLLWFRLGWRAGHFPQGLSFHTQRQLRHLCSDFQGSENPRSGLGEWMAIRKERGKKEGESRGGREGRREEGRLPFIVTCTEFW